MISSIKTIETLFSGFFPSYLNRYSFVHKHIYSWLTNLKYSSAWLGDMPVEAGQCLSRCYLREII